MAQRSLYLMGDYLPMAAVIAGLVVFSVILAVCVAIAVLSVLWRSFYGKLMFCIVLGLILVSAVFRIAFFGITVKIEHFIFVDFGFGIEKIVKPIGSFLPDFRRI